MRQDWDQTYLFSTTALLFLGFLAVLLIKAFLE